MEELLKRFSNFKISVEGKSESTVNQYLARIEKFLGKANITTSEELMAINKDNIIEWLSLLAKEGNAPSSRNSKLTAVKELFKYMSYQEDIVIDNKILLLQCAKTKKREAKYLDEMEFEALIYSMGNPRTKAMAETIWATGVRFSELGQITLRDIDNGFAKVIGKGNKERTIYFPPRCLKFINQYIKNKRTHIVERTGKETDTLFISDEGNPVSRGKFEESLKHYAKVSGIDWWEHMSPHKLRHSYATYKLQERNETGGLKNDIATVSYSLGHANIATTNTYVHAKDEQVRRMQLGE